MTRLNNRPPVLDFGPRKRKIPHLSSVSTDLACIQYIHAEMWTCRCFTGGKTYTAVQELEGHFIVLLPFSWQMDQKCHDWINSKHFTRFPVHSREVGAGVQGRWEGVGGQRHIRSKGHWRAHADCRGVFLYASGDVTQAVWGKIPRAPWRHEHRDTHAMYPQPANSSLILRKFSSNTVFGISKIHIQP